MRARHSIIAFIGLGLVATIACSRNANQANFIGADCAAQADCPSELVCVNKKCWEPCQPDGTCKTPGFTCILGACQGGPAAQGGESEGGVGTDPQGQANTDPVDPGIETQSDGEPIVTGIMFGASQVGGVFMRCAGGTAYLRYEFSDPLNGPSSKIVKQSIAAPTAWAPEDVVVSNKMHDTFEASANYVLYDKEVAGPGGMALFRRAADLSSAEEQLALTFGSAPGESRFIDGDDIFFVDQSGDLRVFNWATNTLDSNTYGNISGAPFSGFHLAKNGSELIWITQDINGGKVYTTTKGGGVGVDRNVTGIQAQTMIMSTYVVGGKAQVFLNGGGSGGGGLLYEAAPSSALAPVPSWTGPSDAILRGNVAYYTKSGTTGQVLAKYDFVTKQETVSTKRIFSADASCLTDTAFYAVERLPDVPTGPTGGTSSGGTSSSGGGGGTTGGTKETYRISKFPLP